MPRPKNTSPSYLLHKPSGRARVRLKDGSRYRDVYLGGYGSPESREKYHRILAEYFGANGNGQKPNATASDEDDWTVATLAVKYDDFASKEYVKDGEPTDDRYRAVIPPLVQLYGSTLVREFGPKKLKALREYIVKRGNARTAKFDSHGNLLKSGKPLGREYVNNLMMLSTLVKMLLFLAVIGVLAAVISSSIVPMLVVAGVGYSLICVYQGLTR